MYSIGITGIGGRMGRMLLSETLNRDDCRIAGGTERAGSPLIGTALKELDARAPEGILVGDAPEALFEQADVVIDFTMPQATLANAEIAARTGRAMVIGTTGFSAEEEKRIEDAAATAPIVKAGNMSLGVNLLVQVTRQVARALDLDFDAEIVEMHHRYKIDAPSGTALMLGRAVAEGRGQEHDAVAVRGRDGITGERPRGAIGYAALRGGNVVGDHTVIFAADNERIELTHKAADRAIFARGALHAALWLKGRAPGLYSMADVLGLQA